MPKLSAGILLFRHHAAEIQVLLVHPGGPFFKNKDDGSWTIPKGEPNAGEDLFDAARREFEEEIGHGCAGDFLPLTPVMQKGGKVVHGWAVEGEIDTAAIKSNTFRMEWPPKSGKTVEFPEIDRAGFFDLATARTKINPGQTPLLDELVALLGGREKR